MKILKNRRGTFPDKLYALFLFGFVVVLVIAYGMAWSITQPVIRNLGGIYTENAMDLLAPADVINWLDIAIVITYFAINIMVCIILPFYVDNNPALVGVFAFLILISILPIAIYSNALVDFISGFSPTFRLTIFLLENLVLLEVIFMLLMGTVLYFKGRSNTPYY